MTSKSLGGQSTHSDICRARELKWRNAPPGFSLEMAETFMGKLRDGKSIRQLTSGTTSIDYIASFARFGKQCELNPQWGEEARRLSMISGNRHKSENHGKRIALMCQAGLHSMTGDNVKIQGPAGGHRRYCAACRRATDLRARTMTVEEIVAVKAALLKGASIGQITQGRPVGGGATNVSLVLVRPKLLKRYREENPEFDHFVINRFEGSRLRLLIKFDIGASDGAWSVVCCHQTKCRGMRRRFCGRRTPPLLQCEPLSLGYERHPVRLNAPDRPA